VEEFFGDVQDEYEKPEDQPGAKTDAARKYAELDARSYVADANAALEPLGLSIPESEDYDTVGGYVTVTLGRIPQRGEKIVMGGEEEESGRKAVQVTVLDAEPTRLVKLKLEAVAPTNGTAASAAGAIGGPQPVNELKSRARWWFRIMRRAGR
jgi:CBS domain containing-hemolysin-like protein